MLEQSIILSSEQIIEEAYRIVAPFSHRWEEAAFPLSIPLFKSMADKIRRGEKLLFILPAFPAKSPSPKKTSGVLPDMGELLALTELNEMCQKLNSLYAPGAKLIICSDGRVFSDVVLVQDSTIDDYAQGIEDMIKANGLDYLSTFSMDELYPHLKGDQLRERLLLQFGKSLEEVKYLVKSDPDFERLFNGVHRFLLEDQLVLHPEKSRNQVHKESKVRTYELLRRSDAWSVLLNHYFPHTLRLSIHPYRLEHEKFGIKMVRSSSKWATPWHNVTVKIKDKFELMHLEEAMKLGAQRKLHRGQYVYYEV